MSTKLVDENSARLYSSDMITKEQCRAARGFLNWSQSILADRAGVDRSTVKDFESGRHTPNRTNMAAIVAALEMAGLEFTNGKQPGVKQKQNG
jgi:transcriptional regulator with XRE-family HTH domain